MKKGTLVKVTQGVLALNIAWKMILFLFFLSVFCVNAASRLRSASGWPTLPGLAEFLLMGIQSLVLAYFFLSIHSALRRASLETLSQRTMQIFQRTLAAFLGVEVALFTCRLFTLKTNAAEPRQIVELITRKEIWAGIHPSSVDSALRAAVALLDFLTINLNAGAAAFLLVLVLAYQRIAASKTAMERELAEIV